MEYREDSLLFVVRYVSVLGRQPNKVRRHTEYFFLLSSDLLGNRYDVIFFPFFFPFFFSVCFFSYRREMCGFVS